MLLLPGSYETPIYVEDLHSVTKYTGTGAARGVTTGVNMSEYGGTMLMQALSSALSPAIYTTDRGATKDLAPDSTAAETTQTTGLTAFSTTGVTLGALAKINNSGDRFAAWAFRKGLRFHSVVSWQGNGTTKTIPHFLGTAVGLLIVKCTSTTGAWATWHRSLTSGRHLFFNAIDAETNTNAVNYFGNNTITVDPTSTEFTVGSNSAVNANGETYEALLFSHDTDTGGVIKCGSFTTDGSGIGEETLDWEPQTLAVKRRDSTGNWTFLDTTRGWNLSTSDLEICPNTAAVENTASRGNPVSDGFSVILDASATYVYMAIRKGLMRPPTDATQVFAINSSTGTGAARSITGIPFLPDVHLAKRRSTTSGPDASNSWQTRQRGLASQLFSDSSAAQQTYTDEVTAFNHDGVTLGASADGNTNYSTTVYINYFIRQARTFADLVTYEGTGSAKNVPHNLWVTPEFAIIKATDAIADWFISRTITATATTFSVGTGTDVNGSGNTYEALLFASVPGVSKIGALSSGAQNVDCGFASGARFVLILASTGFYYFDTLRGIVSGNDPYLRLDADNDEQLGTDYLDPYAGGFTINGITGQSGYLAIA